MVPHAPYDAIVLGGGPAGSAVGRLLSAWGYSILILDAPAPRSRGLAESLPPSTQKLLAQIGVLDAVERAGFFRATGNTVWWGSGDRRVETFQAPGAREAMGYQIHRPDFDRVLLENARDAGADVRADAKVKDVRFDSDRSVAVDYDDGELGRRTAAGRFVLDCTGRAGLVGRRFQRSEPGYRTCALVGVWKKAGGWDLPDETHTIVETYDEGWMWSVPVSRDTRHVGAMVDRASSTVAGGRELELVYRAETAKATNLGRLLDGATLDRVWTCDASLYSSAQYAGPQFLLIGDAASFIDPLSSFGVKKALASAWLGAVAVHTCLTDAGRKDVALDFFSNWEREVYAKHLGRSREFAREAQARHPHAFWASRAATTDAGDVSEMDVARDPDVVAAFERFKQASSVHLTLADHVRFEPRPVIRDREIVLENAFVDQAGLETRPTSERSKTRPTSTLRFMGNVDLVKLADIACRHTDVPDVFEDYCRTCAPVPLPSVVGGLSVLVAKGILHERV
ncbi:MAG: tryptophan 7-halogenase [Acidobacteria bacterium]|nr:tryptophan 7-halogenase [Acidobacteriota bacterium]